MRVLRVLGALVLAAATGCTNVQVAQRDGCWVRETKQTFRGKKQEVGPCLRQQPAFVEDRLTRLVQECIAQADWRWHSRALDAWNRKQPIPAQDPRETVIDTCMNEAAGGSVTQNETLRARLAEVTEDREALRADAAKSSEHMRASNERLAGFLGEALNEAAKRPPPVATATATATSDGTATTESGLQAETGSASHALPTTSQVMPVVPATQPPAPAAEASAAPPEKAKRQARTPRKAVVRPARNTACELPAPAAAHPETGATALAASPTAAPAPAGALAAPAAPKPGDAAAAPAPAVKPDPPSPADAPKPREAPAAPAEP